MAALADSVRELEQRAAASAVESAARVEALGVEVAAAAAGRAALEGQLLEHEVRLYYVCMYIYYVCMYI